MLSTFLPSFEIVPGCLKASRPVVIVSTSAAASVKNGSHRGPAKTRRPSASAPVSSLTTKETPAPVEAAHRPAWTDPVPSAATVGGANVQSIVISPSSAATEKSPGW
jgi:hypothetical protein